MGLLGVGGGGDSVEVANQEGVDGGRFNVGPQGSEEGLTGKTVLGAGGGMKVKEGEGASCDELANTGLDGGGRCAGDTGQDSNGALA